VHFACDWLVGMSVKASGELRVGCGRYDWYFDGRGKVEKLVILAEVVNVLPASELTAVMDWLSAALSCPWCRADQALARLPAAEGLGAIKAHLKQAGRA